MKTLCFALLCLLGLALANAAFIDELGIMPYESLEERRSADELEPLPDESLEERRSDFTDDVDIVRVVSRETKKLQKGLTFVTTKIGPKNYKCECYQGGKKIFAGVCGTADKSFDYRMCN